MGINRTLSLKASFIMFKVTDMLTIKYLNSRERGEVLSIFLHLQ